MRKFYPTSYDLTTLIDVYSCYQNCDNKQTYGYIGIFSGVYDTWYFLSPSELIFQNCFSLGAGWITGFHCRVLRPKLTHYFFYNFHLSLTSVRGWLKPQCSLCRERGQFLTLITGNKHELNLVYFSSPNYVYWK